MRYDHNHTQGMKQAGLARVFSLLLNGDLQLFTSLDFQEERYLVFGRYFCPNAFWSQDHRGARLSREPV
jgi:hypothetical protein